MEKKGENPLCVLSPSFSWPLDPHPFCGFWVLLLFGQFFSQAAEGLPVHLLGGGRVRRHPHGARPEQD